jgi:hypothetical protein
MTECTQSVLEFGRHGGRKVEARFDGGTISSDGGALLLREADRRMRLVERFSRCFLDGREQSQVQHPLAEMIAQRVYGLALGYEDLNDHEQLRDDAILQLMAGQEPGKRLAGKSTLNRLELGAGKVDRYKKITYWKDSIDDLLVQVFVEAHRQAPPQIVVDLDTTDLALHGKQEGRFFHGYYDHYCYLPLYIFCGDHVLCARLREANRDAAAGSLPELQRIIGQIRAAWPSVQIILRGDSGFCRDEIMRWCEQVKVDYVFGMARNKRLQRVIGQQLHEAHQQWERTQRPARVFTEFDYQTKSKSWARERRVVAKAEQIEGKSNPRFVVTSLPATEWPAQKLYEELYCARGDMENRIKEQFCLLEESMKNRGAHAAT